MDDTSHVCVYEFVQNYNLKLQNFDEREEIFKQKMSLPVKLYHPTLLRCTVVKKVSKQSPTLAKKDGELANRMKDLYGSMDAMYRAWPKSLV